MIVFKCKMCGGDLDISSNSTIAKCPYCGANQTLPRLDNERKLNLFDRAIIYAEIMIMIKLCRCMRIF